MACCKERKVNIVQGKPPQQSKKIKDLIAGNNDIRTAIVFKDGKPKLIK